MDFAFETSDFDTELEDMEVRKIGKFDRVWSGGEGGSIVRTTLIGNMLYYGAFDGYVYALDLDSGKIKWQTKCDALFDSSPVFYEGLLYLGDREGTFYCLDEKTGKEVWRFRLGDGMAGYAGVKEGVVYTSCRDSNFYAINAKTGILLWRFKTGRDMCCAPGFYRETIIVGSFDGYIYCLGSKNGKEIWRVKTGAEIHCPNGPEFHGKTVFVSSFDSYLYAINAETGKIVWRTKLGDYGVATSPTIFEERIYIGARDGNLYCMNSEGKELWRFRTGGVVESKSAIFNGLIYFGSEDGCIYCVDMDGHVVWQSTKIDGQIWDKPKIYKGKIFFGSSDCKIHAIDLATGQELWSVQTSTLRKAIWSDPYGMFRAEIKKETHVEEPISEDRYKSKKKGETISLSDYHIESEYSATSEYKTKSDYDVDFVMFEGTMEEITWISGLKVSSPRISKLN